MADFVFFVEKIYILTDNELIIIDYEEYVPNFYMCLICYSFKILIFNQALVKTN